MSFGTFSQNKFTFDFYNQLDGEENILFSPISIKTAFAMVYEGADSETKKEFETVFNFKPDNSSYYDELKQLKEVAKISNSVWIQRKFDVLDSYIKTLKKHFETEPYSTDFLGNPNESADKINEADSVIFQTEKQLKEYADKLPADAKANIEAALAKLKFISFGEWNTVLLEKPYYSNRILLYIVVFSVVAVFFKNSQELLLQNKLRVRSVVWIYTSFLFALLLLGDNPQFLYFNF